MKTSVFANAAILAGVAAAQLRLPLVHSRSRGSALARRDADAEVSANGLRYSVNVTVGTPPQEFSIDLSLASDVSWVPDALDCDGACDGGSFNSGDSSTYNDSSNSYFSIYYDDGSSVYGDEFTDTIRVGDNEVNGFTMGLASNGFNYRGELAIGPSVEYGRSLIEYLIDDSVIQSAAFSFWLGGEDGDAGNLLFGAVDTSAFEAPLQRISTRSDESYYVGFPVDFSILNYTSSPDSDPEVIAPQNDLPLILVQPTDMITNLPSSIAKKIWHLAGAKYDRDYQQATISCSGGSSPDSELIIGLGVNGNATARVSFKDLVIPRDVSPIGSSSDDDDTCMFAIQSRSSTGDLSDDEYEPWALGGVVLQNTYVVFDLVNDEVALAPVRSGTGEVVPFPSYGAEIPHSEEADPISYSDGYPYDYDRPGNGTSFPILLIIVILLAVGGFISFITLMFCCWYRGWCCCKGRRKKMEPAVLPPQGGPLSEKVVYAGALPPVLPPRAVLAGEPPGALPLGCAWITAPAPYVMPGGPVAPAPAESRDGPSDGQTAAPAASQDGPSDGQTAAPAASPAPASGPATPPARGSVDRPASPPAGPSTRSPSPGAAQVAEETMTPAVAGPSTRN